MPLLRRARPLLPRHRRRQTFDRAVAEFFMRIALAEARKGLGRTSPNPVVGAILVKGGRVISRGYHRKAGTAHAEVVALEAAGKRARGADLYTTLEPCDHFGKTPPCSLAILEAGVRRVFCASADPNPLVLGKGVLRLRRAGVPVETGVLAAEADLLNRPFFKFQKRGLPWVTLKAAVSLDGKMATSTGDSRWVTGPAARERVHHLRDQFDAVLVGANTARKDNPRLTTRLPGGKGRDAVRVVVDSRLSLSPKLQVFSARSPARCVVATLISPSSKKAQALAAQGVEVWQVPAYQGRPDLKALLRRLAKEAGVLSVLVEGGSEVFGSLLRRNLADELALFLAPKLVGKSGLSWGSDLGVRKMSKAVELATPSVEPLGSDLLLTVQMPSA